MLLAADIGNTHITLGLLDGHECTASWRLASDSRRPAEEYAALLSELFRLDGANLTGLRGAVVASVVPSLSKPLGEAIRRVTGLTPYHITHESRLPIANAYGAPDEVGIDRLANAAGGVEVFGAPVVIVDLGTAVTLDVVSRDREYLGGAIMPGIGLSAEALGSRTAKLPLIAAETPGRFIGRTTAESIASGILEGLIGGIDHLIEGIWEELGYKTATAATGGHGSFIIRRSAHVRKYDPHLTLRGMACAYEMNVEGDAGR